MARSSDIVTRRPSALAFPAVEEGLAPLAVRRRERSLRRFGLLWRSRCCDWRLEIAPAGCRWRGEGGSGEDVVPAVRGG